MNVELLLRECLARPLPGNSAHAHMLPSGSFAITRLKPPPPSALPSAVLVPLVVHDAEPHVLFTVRSSSLRNHGGQISFPGGRIDHGESPEQAAVRELFEEVGITRNNVDVLGRLTALYIPPSNSAVTPVVGLVKQTQPYHLSADEVGEVFTVPLRFFIADNSVQTLSREYGGQVVQWPMWSVHPTVPLWGATAMILSELVSALKGVGYE